MNIAILGYGKEGRSAEKFFQNQGDSCQVFDHFTDAELDQLDLSKFDLILRSPSIRPRAGWSSVTKYFFDHCPCPIIGVTGTKGKGTTCSFIKSLLDALGQRAWLVGNIGTPALDVLTQIQPTDIVVYEMSSFQLWDLEKSPHVAVVLKIEPDHLNVHKDFSEYVQAKANIVRFQKPDDFCIYFEPNPVTTKIVSISKAAKVAYPSLNRPALEKVLDAVTIPGQHNRENAEAALTAVACACHEPLQDFIANYSERITLGLKGFKGLPHRLEFLRELNHVKYYDDNFATTLPALEVAVQAFKDENVVLIAGGRDKTDNADIPDIAKFIANSENIKTAVLIGESGHAIASHYPSQKFIVAETLADAINIARSEAEQFRTATVLMSPAAASFDMFENVYDRGAQFQWYVGGLS